MLNSLDAESEKRVDLRQINACATSEDLYRSECRFWAIIREVRFATTNAERWPSLITWPQIAVTKHRPIARSARLGQSFPCRCHTGEKLGPYEIIAPLGAGGWGSVATLYPPKRDVALKILPEELRQGSHPARAEGRDDFVGSEFFAC